MLTAGDDFPIHQTPEPVAFAGTDRNFYDRYFFNGYSADGNLFFAAALGVYPHLDVMDAAFCLLIDGKQHNVRASKRMLSERMDLTVGPIKIEVLEPLQKLAVKVAGNDGGASADLVFDARHRPIEEPRFTRRQGPRLFMDYTRLTQNGAWSGTITLDGRKIPVDAKVRGTRDRSWGIRPVGAPDPQPPHQPGGPQFYWLWAPMNFDKRVAFLHTNDDGDGAPWNRAAVVDEIGGGRTHYDHPQFELAYVPGTRRLAHATARLADNGPSLRIEPMGKTFYMSGLGYTHPVWGHGRDHGELEVACDVLDTATLNDNAPEHMHIQAISRATLDDGRTRTEGVGVLEQLLLGPHAPSGFKGLLDPAP